MYGEPQWKIGVCESDWECECYIEEQRNTEVYANW